MPKEARLCKFELLTTEKEKEKLKKLAKKAGYPNCSAYARAVLGL